MEDMLYRSVGTETAAAVEHSPKRPRTTPELGAGIVNNLEGAEDPRHSYIYVSINFQLIVLGQALG